jgi:hypothetical protein
MIKTMPTTQGIWAALACAELMLLVACGSRSAGEGATQEGSAAPAATPTGNESLTSSPGVSASADPTVPRACDEFRELVKVTYQVVSRPADVGNRIWVRLHISNPTPFPLYGVSSGWMVVTRTATGSSDHLEWGGSSSDVTGAAPGSASKTDVYDAIGHPLLAHPGARITHLGVSTRLANERGNAPFGDGCDLPARMRAPRGLVSDHPSGRWQLSISAGARIMNEAFKQCHRSLKTDVGRCTP